MDSGHSRNFGNGKINYTSNSRGVLLCKLPLVGAFLSVSGRFVTAERYEICAFERRRRDDQVDLQVKEAPKEEEESGSDEPDFRPLRAEF